MSTRTDSVEPRSAAYAPSELRRFAAALFREAGLELDKPDVEARLPSSGSRCAIQDRGSARKDSRYSSCGVTAG